MSVREGSFLRPDRQVQARWRGRQDRQQEGLDIILAGLAPDAIAATVGYKKGSSRPPCSRVPRMTFHDRLAQLSDPDFIALWNKAGTTDEAVEQVVVRVGRVPRWAVVARGVALRKAGHHLKTLGPATSPSSASPAA